MRASWVPSLLLVVALPATASATDKAACARSYEQAQRSRQSGHYLEARRELIACVASCSESFSIDCSKWHAEVEALTPSVVIRARDESNRDLVDVRVETEQRVLSERLDGRAIELDPGTTTLRISTKSTATTITVVLREGEKARTVDVVLSAPLIETRKAPAPDSPSNTTKPPVLAYALGGVALLSLGSLTYFGLSGISERSDLASCSPTCDDSVVDPVKTKFLVADISLAVSVVSAAAALYLFLRSAPEPRGSAARSPMLR